MSAIHRFSGKGHLKERLVPYLFIAPFLFSFLLFFAFPALYSLVLSFFNYKGYGTATFIGFRNYNSLLNYQAFWNSVGNTMFYFVMHSVPAMIFAFTFAVLLHGKSVSSLRKIYKPILFMPQVVPAMASILTFRVIFSTTTGVINQILNTNIGWLENTTLMRWSVVLFVIWRSTGWFMIVYLSGLTTINPSLYESAMLDGANGLQRIFYVTIPLMRPIFIFAFIMDAISSFKIYTEVNVLIAGMETAPTDAAPIMNMVTNNMRNGRFGMASAAGWLLFIIILIISMLEFMVMREKRGDQT